MKSRCPYCLHKVPDLEEHVTRCPDYISPEELADYLTDLRDGVTARRGESS